MAAGDEMRGLYTKYVVKKIETGEVLENCFVLRPEQDGFARAALACYAEACSESYPRLAEDIRHWLEMIALVGGGDQRG